MKMTYENAKPLTIFIHRASECLTDHESHGDGLICFSLLNGLAERGHQVYAYANTAPIRQCSPNLHVKTAQHRVPANSLAPWEHAWRADRWMRELAREHNFDLVWRMHPYHGSCPMVPQTLGKPLIVGPLFYGWPETSGEMPKTGQPRFGVGLQGIVGPLAERGWQQTLQAASLILCATGRHAELVHQQHPPAEVRELPVIVEPPLGLLVRGKRGAAKSVALLFVANLVAYKNTLLFCETIQHLREKGIPVQGVILGEGPERANLEAFCATNDLAQSVCFRGKVPNSEVYAELSEANFLVSTSLGEPYGRGIAEAMSVGTPAVCHRSGGPADFIDDGQDGLLVNELTGAAYADAVGQAMAAGGTWDMLSANARRKAENWHSDVVLNRLEAYLYVAMADGK